MADISVIIPFHGDPEILHEVLHALKQQETTRTFECILVDSTPEHLAEKAAEGFDIHLVHSPQKLLPGKARNAGLKTAGGRYIAFLDADCIPKTDWLERMAAVVEQHPGQAVAGAVDRKASSCLARASHLAEFSGYSSSDKKRTVSKAGSGNLMVSRDTAGDLTFPEDLATCEDVVYCQRLREKGIHLHFEPNAVVHHACSPSLPGFLQHQLRQGRGSGRARKKYRLSGSRVTRFVPTLPLLPFWLTGTALLRTIRAGHLGLFDLLLVWPLVFLGKCWYTLGFARGIGTQGANV